MTTVSYLLSVSTTLRKDGEIFLIIQNIAGRGHAISGSLDGIVSTDLWLIPNGRQARQEVITQLQAVPAITNLSVIALSKPLKQSEIAEVWELFANKGWDAGSVTDDEIALFIDDRLRGQYTYYIDFDPKEMEKGSAKISIKPMEEHPGFSPDWLKKSNHIENEPDRDLTIDDITIESITIESEEEDIEAPPPPPFK